MVQEKSLLKMVINMKANFIMDFCMEKVNLLGAMALNMKGSLLTIELQAVEFTDGLMEAFTKER